MGFSDSVFSIAITLLVLGLEVPSAHEVPEQKLPTYLYESMHSVLSYIVSFWVIGVYWLQHYSIGHYIVRVNRPFIFLNLLFLLTISVIPFPTGLQSTYRFDELAVLLYGATDIVSGLVLLSMWRYATTNHRLVDKNVPREVVVSMSRRIALTPLVCLVAIGLSFVNVLLGKFVFLLIPVFYFSHRTVDQEEGVAPDQH